MPRKALRLIIDDESTEIMVSSVLVEKLNLKIEHQKASLSISMA